MLRLSKASHSFLWVQIQDGTSIQPILQKVWGQVCFRIWNVSSTLKVMLFIKWNKDQKTSHLIRSSQIFQNKLKNLLFSEYFGFGNLDKGLGACNAHLSTLNQKL